MSVEYSIAFWNVENLFDIEDWPERSEKLRRVIGRDLRGGHQPQRDRKIDQLAAALAQVQELFG